MILVGNNSKMGLNKQRSHLGKQAVLKDFMKKLRSDYPRINDIHDFLSLPLQPVLIFRITQTSQAIRNGVNRNSAIGGR